MHQLEYTECQICNIPLKGVVEEGGIVKVGCNLCGHFLIERNIFDDLRGTYPRQLKEGGWVKLSHYSRMQNMYRKKALFTAELVASLLSGTFQTLQQQQSNLLLYLGYKGKAGHAVIVRTSLDFPVIGSHDKEGFKLILTWLRSQGFVNTSEKETIGGGMSTVLTIPGLIEFEKLKNTSTSFRCFMAMQFNNSRVKRLYEDHITKAVADLGCQINIVTDEQTAGLIDDQILMHLNLAKFIIADVSDRNLNVFWEAGYAEGQGTPVIYICEKESFKDNHPFDTNHRLHVLWEAGEEQDFTRRLKATVSATFPDL